MLFRLERTSDIDLVFDGVLLGQADTKTTPSQPRWTEVSLYRTDSGKYVSDVVGRSTLPGERDRILVKVVDNPIELRESLRREGDAGLYLTDVALDALHEAAQNDPGVAAAIAERI